MNSRPKQDRIRLLLRPLAAFFLLLSTPIAGAQDSAPQPTTLPPRIEAYDSWKLAGKGEDREAVITSPTTIYAPEGFAVELLRAAADDEDSWVGMTFDDKGRLYVAREKQGILRMTLGPDKVTKVELVEDSLLECRGLLWAYDSLYANANNSKGFYRLRDTDGDDRFDETRLLLSTTGGVGHGRNHLRLGPDGLIYLVHGNNVEVDPKILSPTSTFRDWGEDQLILNPWDDDWNKLPAPAGHILRTDKDGSFFELIAGGLRNPLDIDFDLRGEAFVYEADSEWDAGLDWYKPTRILHVVSGGEYGWRRGTGKWPAYYEDSLPAVYNVGFGSPTGVGFGYQSSYPEKYRKAYYIADWSYGRIIAYHMTPQGASYIAEPETFISGRPLNVTDFVFRQDDGAMYFITGGRRTQSALYRVRWTGEPHTEKLKPEALGEYQKLRWTLEALHHRQEEGDWKIALKYIDHPDRYIRNAARIALEHQPVKRWRRAALESGSPYALMALARTGGGEEWLRAPVLEALKSLPLADWQGDSGASPRRLAALRAYQLAFTRLGDPTPAESVMALEILEPLYPVSAGKSLHAQAENHELCELLVYLQSSAVLDRTLTLLDATPADATPDLTHYLVFLRYVQDGWDTEKRKRYLEHLARAEAFPGGRWYLRTTQDLRKEAVASLTEPQKEELAALLEPAQAAPGAAGDLELPEPGPFVKAWTLTDFQEDLRKPLSGRSLEKGRQTYHAAACAVCHRMEGDESTWKSVLGPDLTAVGQRFGPQDLLESIIEPSLAISDIYRNPSAPNISVMPPGLINTLKRDQILDLLNYLINPGATESAAAR